MSTRQEVSAHHVTKTVTARHAIPILEFVIRVAWMDTGEIIAIKRARKIVMVHAHNTLDIARVV